ncbi:MAG: hypothetical protein ACE5JE_00945 [Thermoplasmata archaeon]
MRRLITAALLVIGAVLMVSSYFVLAAPWGFPPTSAAFSDPAVPFAAGFFIIGFLLLFLSAVVYEVAPGE